MEQNSYLKKEQKSQCPGLKVGNDRNLPVRVWGLLTIQHGVSRVNSNSTQLWSDCRRINNKQRGWIQRQVEIWHPDLFCSYNVISWAETCWDTKPRCRPEAPSQRLTKGEVEQSPFKCRKGQRDRERRAVVYRSSVCERVCVCLS